MIHVLLTVLDLGGTFVFAISGAVAAARHRLDIFGVMVLAFAAGNAGGITRDLLIGAVPPAAIASWSYLGVSILAGLVVFFRQPLVARLEYPVQWFDAIGLAFFAVAGAQKALLHGLGPVMSALLGMLTGIGGGMLRDVLVREIPVVLRADLYAFGGACRCNRCGSGACGPRFADRHGDRRRCPMFRVAVYGHQPWLASAQELVPARAGKGGPHAGR